MSHNILYIYTVGTPVLELCNVQSASVCIDPVQASRNVCMIIDGIMQYRVYSKHPHMHTHTHALTHTAYTRTHAHKKHKNTQITRVYKPSGNPGVNWILYRWQGALEFKLPPPPVFTASQCPSSSATNATMAQLTLALDSSNPISSGSYILIANHPSGESRNVTLNVNIDGKIAEDIYVHKKPC